MYRGISTDLHYKLFKIKKIDETEKELHGMNANNKMEK